MKALRTRLSSVGIKRRFLDTVILPSWWDDAIAATPGGFREAVGHVAAHLGFSLASLLDEDTELTFAGHGGVKFKKAKGIAEDDVSLATHYAIGVGRTVASALDDVPLGAVPNPEEWRKELLAMCEGHWVCLRRILQATWQRGIPVIHLRNLPPGSKKPDALTTMVGERPVIVVFKNSKSPSWIAFIVAHELGHIHHKHLKAGQTLVDEKIDQKSDEADEGEANDFALSLLTGFDNLGLNSTRSLSIPLLAEAAKRFGSRYRVAPGVAALNYGFTTKEWALANGAVSLLEKNEDAGKDLKKAMDDHLDLDALSDDSREWITRATTSPE
jgi:hypothetical protein